VGLQADEVRSRATRPEGLPAGSPFSSRAGVAALAVAAALGLARPAAVQAQPAAPALDGTRTITLHARDGSSVAIGKVHFTPAADGRVGFRIERDTAAFTDHFLSMREFKCVEGRGEILCHVPYPYPQPGLVSSTDLAWLEHALLFMFKLPGDFGAKLWNGIYFRLQPAPGGGWVGTPQAVDLNLIGAPPARPELPPYGPARRDDIRPGARWFERLTID
jgi:hypothetical protein